MSYHAVPLADKGFVPTDPIMNPVRWYVVDDARPSWTSLPFETMDAADAHAAAWNLERS